jgi:hypothetical protein
MTCEKCPEVATWEFDLRPIKDEVQGFCLMHAQELQAGIQSVRDMKLEQKQNLLSRLRPLAEAAEVR